MPFDTAKLSWLTLIITSVHENKKILELLKDFPCLMSCDLHYYLRWWLGSTTFNQSLRRLFIISVGMGLIRLNIYAPGLRFTFTN